LLGIASAVVPPHHTEAFIALSEQIVTGVPA
jgi:hypothetical protein